MIFDREANARSEEEIGSSIISPLRVNDPSSRNTMEQRWVKDHIHLTESNIVDTDPGQE